LISDVRYHVMVRSLRNGGPGPWRRDAVEGMRVGRFAVRMKLAGTVVQLRDARLFIVDHTNTGCALADFTSFDHALAFADDVSRYSSRDAATRDPAKLPDQLGLALVQWCTLCAEHGRYVPFRQWRDLCEIVEGKTVVRGWDYGA
jgi:hypothetical protein